MLQIKYWIKSSWWLLTMFAWNCVCLHSNCIHAGCHCSRIPYLIWQLIDEVTHKTCIFISAIEGDYEGPKLSEDGKVSAQFTEDLMTTYRAQGKLHQRYAYQVKYVFVTWLHLSCRLIMHWKCMPHQNGGR